MPKLPDKDVERNQVRIEQAALRLFTRRGFHGTSVRDIADAAGVSLGNIYNYYPTKDALFKSLVRRYAERMGELQRKTLAPLIGSLEPEALTKLAAAVRQIVYGNPDYWRLMYIDVTEFGNRHFAHIFRGLSQNLQKLAGPGWARAQATCRHDVDPGLAFSAIYLHFFTYFLVEKLFGGKHHLGMPDDRAIEQLVRIFTAGAANGSVAKPPATTSPDAPAQGNLRRERQ